MTNKKIGIIASGGDGSGMNACVFYLTSFLTKKGYKVVYFQNGYNGVINNKVAKTDIEDLRNNINNGGCIIGAGRCPEYSSEEGRKKAVETLAKHNIEGLIVIGGDGSIKGIQDGAPYGLKGIGVPATIDNDCFHSDYSLGHDSAVNANIVQIKAAKMSSFTMGVLPLIETMGRHCGKLALASAIASGAHICAVKEVPMSEEELINKIKVLKKAGKQNIVTVVAEKIYNIDDLAKKIEEQTNSTVRTTVCGYTQRGANTSAFDRILAASLAKEAVKLVEQGKWQQVVGQNSGSTYHMPITNMINSKTNFDFELYNAFFS